MACCSSRQPGKPADTAPRRTSEHALSTCFEVQCIRWHAFPVSLPSASKPLPGVTPCSMRVMLIRQWMHHLVVVRGHVGHETLEGVTIGVAPRARHGARHGVDGGERHLCHMKRLVEASASCSNHHLCAKPPPGRHQTKAGAAPHRQGRRNGGISRASAAGSRCRRAWAAPSIGAWAAGEQSGCGAAAAPALLMRRYLPRTIEQA